MRSLTGASITAALQAELEQRVHVGAQGAGEAPYLRLQPGSLDQLDRPPVLLGDAGEARLDPVDSEVVQQPRDLELLIRVEDDADRLLAVAERRVVEPDLAADAHVVVHATGPDPVAHVRYLSSRSGSCRG